MTSTDSDETASAVRFLFGLPCKVHASTASLSQKLTELQVANLSDEKLEQILTSAQLDDQQKDIALRTRRECLLLSGSLGAPNFRELAWRLGVLPGHRGDGAAPSLFASLRIRLEDGHAANIEIPLPKVYDLLHELEKAKAAAEMSV